MLTIVDDTCGRHDTVGGACSCESNTVRYGHHTSTSTPASRTSCSAGAATGSASATCVSNVNWFMNVPVEPDGTLGIVDGISAPGKYVELRAEMDVARRRVELPADQQPLQRLRPDAGAHGRDPAAPS